MQTLPDTKTVASIVVRRKVEGEGQKKGKLTEYHTVLLARSVPRQQHSFAASHQRILQAKTWAGLNSRAVKAGTSPTENTTLPTTITIEA